MDVNNIPGLDRVDRLAEYLVGLRNQTSLALSNQDVSSIVGMWEDLLPYDQQRVVFSARHQDRLLTGRFRSPKKKAEFTPGVESVRRCTIASTASPAQWPDCCRVLESIFVRLCNIHKCPSKKGKTDKRLTRWTLILQDYRRIRQLILANGAVMTSTSLQLVEVNQTTLIQWHNKRVARQDVSLLCQGVDLPAPIPVATEALPAAIVRPAIAPQQPGVEHKYNLPESTAGRAKTNKRKPTATATAVPAVSVRPRMATERQLYPRPPQFGAPAPVCSSTPALSRAPAPVGFAHPGLTQAPAFFMTQAPAFFGTPALPQAQSHPGAPPFVFAVPSAVPPHATPRKKKTYNRTGEPNKCRKCGEPRTALTGHSQFRGTIYCPSIEQVTKEQWLEGMRKRK